MYLLIKTSLHQYDCHDAMCICSIWATSYSVHVLLKGTVAVVIISLNHQQHFWSELPSPWTFTLYKLLMPWRVAKRGGGGHDPVSRTNFNKIQTSRTVLTKLNESRSRDGTDGEQGWPSGESVRLPPMCPGFDSRTRRRMWVEFVVGSLLCSERFFSGYSSIPLPLETNISKFQFNPGMHRHIQNEFLWTPWFSVGKQITFIFFYEST